MHYWESPYIDWSREVGAGDALLIFTLRESRVKALVPAVVEAVTLLGRFAPRPLLVGPQAELRGRFRLAVAVQDVPAVRALLPRLGYSSAVEYARPLDDGETPPDDVPVVTWRSDAYGLVTLYREDAETARDQAPDRRAFVLERGDGTVETVRGYRGDGTLLGRRALPVADARLLVNLVARAGGDRLLDPFAGAGGVVVESVRAGYRTYSADVDPALRLGLREHGAAHAVADARALPFGDAMFTMMATEPPYHPTVQAAWPLMLDELLRVLRPGGCLAMLVVPWQRDACLVHLSPSTQVYLDEAINRKGLDVRILALQKTG